VDEQLPRALVNKAPVISVIIGVNDLLRDYDALRFERNLQTIFTSLTGADTTVVTASYPDIPGVMPIPDSFRRLLRERFAEANTALQKVAGEAGVYLINMHESPEWRDPAMWSPDCLHPGPLGHQRFAEDVAELVTGTTGLTTDWRQANPTLEAAA
jgi:lysophospholipase L1-like esterase